MNETDIIGQVTQVESKRKRLIDWGYGIGMDGYRKTPNEEDYIQAVIIDESFPWWWSPMKSVNINVSKVWLTHTPIVDLNFLSSSWCHGTTFYGGSTLSEEFWTGIQSAEWIVVGGKIPFEVIDKGLWKLPKLKMVIATQRGRDTPPKSWCIQHIKMSHNHVGGVTNGRFEVMIAMATASQKMDIIRLSEEAIPQDLRWVMKSNVEGVFSKRPGVVPSKKAVAKVMFCEKNVIEQAGLLPYNRMDVSIRSEFRGQYWVDRTLTIVERLLALDVPEQLILEFPDEVIRANLLSSIAIPGKVLQSVMSRVSNLAIRGQRSAKRKMDTDEGPGSKRCKIMDGMGRSVNKKEEVLDKLILVKEENGRDMDVHNRKALKNDNAEAVVELWDENVLSGLNVVLQTDVYQKAAGVLRRWLLKVWQVNVSRSFYKWGRERTLTIEEQKAGNDCMRRAYGATCWSWDLGSRPFFWRWPDDYQCQSMLGVKPWMIKSVEKWRRQQRGTGDPTRHKLIADKLLVIRDKHYVEKGRIQSIMPFFDVPKGTEDIRMVYDGSASGLNGCMWAPWFPLPTVYSLIRSVGPGTWLADNDVGEMFHNFMLHETIKEHCGLDLSLYFPLEVSKSKPRLWERWNRLAMGLRNSPYCAIQGMLMAQEIILGDSRDETNVFRWDRVQLNLPGQEDYRPAEPWFTKVRRDGTMAADMYVYVDDIRCTAPTQHEAWRASQRTSSVLGYLGLQDAARKRRSPSQEAGAWTGSVVWTTSGRVSILTTQEKWDKTKAQLKWIAEHMNDKDGLENKTLQSIRGFLVYVARTYRSMIPYLKGIHATIDSWRGGRDEDGWKVKENNELNWEFDENFIDQPVSPHGPKLVRPVPRLKRDLYCLLELTSSVTPPVNYARMSKYAWVIYGFGDASKQGFGASIELSDRRIYWRYGQWRLDEEQIRDNECSDVNMVKERSSNFRELRNLVESLEETVNKGLLNCSEMFMFTDNSTAEAAYAKGTSSSEALFELVLRLRKLEMSGNCTIHVVHIAGTRMIWQGTDGLSRGDKNAGVMAGAPMLGFVPLHLTAKERSDSILPWIYSWCNMETGSGDDIFELSEKEWPTSLNRQGTYLWFPAPTTADVAMEYMAVSIHKRSSSTHIFVCPCLMCSRWFKLIVKATDVVFTIPIGSPVWETSQHEPLIFAITLPLSRKHPWKQGLSTHVQHAGKHVQDMLSRDFERSGTALRELLFHARSMGKL